MNTPTPRTDAESYETDTAYEVVSSDFARTLERELTAVTEQRDKLDDQLDSILLRLSWTQEKMFNAERQRDRLAEALEQIASTDPNWRDCILIAKEALQSLNQTTP